MQMIQIIGRLASDAVRKTRPEGGTYVSFRVLVNESSGNSTKTYTYDVNYADNKWFAHLKAGQRVFVAGRFSTRPRLSKNSAGEDVVFENMSIAANYLEVLWESRKAVEDVPD